jgi:hypothetical protein
VKKLVGIFICVLAFGGIAGAQNLNDVSAAFYEIAKAGYIQIWSNMLKQESVSEAEKSLTMIMVLFVTETYPGSKTPGDEYTITDEDYADLRKLFSGIEGLPSASMPSKADCIDFCSVLNETYTQYITSLTGN